MVNSGTYCWGQGFSYDAWGNIQLIQPNQCSAPGLSPSVNTQNQLTSLGATQVKYDPAGNLTFDGTLTYTWDAENRLSNVAGVNYSYDGDGQRVQKSSGTTYWYGPDGATYEETDNSGNVIADYIYFGGKRFARRDGSNNTTYYVPDHLGTTRTILNSTGSPCYDSDFYPFGGEINYTNTCPQNYKFTGKERDSESGLDNFGARYDSSSLGRFMSPDPLGGKLVDPQTLNRYGYARNNPISLTDPTGMYVCADSDKCDSAYDQAFERARKRDLESKDKKVRSAAAAYGNPTIDNKVHLMFVNISQKDIGGAVTFGLDASGKADGTLNVRISTTQMNVEDGSETGKTAIDTTVAHEGTHVAQDQKLIDSGYKLKFDITHQKAEEGAYSVSERVIETETVTPDGKYNRYNPDWNSKKAIDNYLQRHPDMYPNLSGLILTVGNIPH